MTKEKWVKGDRWYCPLDNKDVIRAITFLESFGYIIYFDFKKDLHMSSGVGIKTSTDGLVIRNMRPSHDNYVFKNIQDLIDQHIEQM